MISSNPISAPQISNGDSLYKTWKEQWSGSIENFYDFLTIPSQERNLFLENLKFEITLRGTVLIHTIIGDKTSIINPGITPEPFEPLL